MQKEKKPTTCLMAITTMMRISLMSYKTLSLTKTKLPPFKEC